MNPGRPLPPVDSDDVPDEFGLLHACLAPIPDPGHAKGRLYPQPAVLCLVTLGLMAGCRSLSAIRRFGHSHPEIMPYLGFRWVPSVPTLSRVLSGVDPAAVRAALQEFTRQLVVQRDLAMEVVAMDAKTLRGGHEDREPLHMLHLFGHHSRVVLDQVPVSKGSGETAGAKTWIAEMASLFPGLAALTADALYADRDLCAAIVAQDFAYLIKLKKPARSLSGHNLSLRHIGCAARCRDPGMGARPQGGAGNPGLLRVGGLQRHAGVSPGRRTAHPLDRPENG